MKNLILCCLLATAAISTGCSDQVGSYASDIKVSDLVGNWNVGSAVAKVEGSDAATLTFTTETGIKGAGAIHGDRIDVPSWNVSGRLTADHKNISWSNKVVWSR